MTNHKVNEDVYVICNDIVICNGKISIHTVNRTYINKLKTTQQEKLGKISNKCFTKAETLVTSKHFKYSQL